MSYATAPLVPLQSTLIPLPDGTVRVALDVFGAPSGRDGVQEAMLEAEFAPERCGSSSSIVATFRYEEMDPGFTLQSSREITVPLLSAREAYASLSPCLRCLSSRESRLPLRWYRDS